MLSLKGRNVTLDTETTGLNYWRGDRPFAVGIAVDDEEPCYFDERETPGVWEWLRRELPHARLLVGFHLKFDLHMLRLKGIEPPPRLYCGMVAEALLDEHRQSYDLDSVGWRCCGFGKLEIDHDNIASLPPGKVRPYCLNDVLLTRGIWREQQHLIDADALRGVLELEMALLPILLDMEHRGVRVDAMRADRAIAPLDARISEAQAEIDALVGHPFNTKSPKQVQELFAPERVSEFQWKLRDGTIVGPTKGGTAPSIDQIALRQMVDPVAWKIMRLRKLIKTRDTFLLGHVLGHTDDAGYVHTTFNQTRSDTVGKGFVGTGSGRLSSTDPALQQINKRDKDTAEIVRSLFLPDDGKEWHTIDHGQIDFRMAAHLINDAEMLAAYAVNPKLDYHQQVADMTGIPRNPQFAGGPNTKTLNLMLAFGAGPGKSAHSMGMPYTLEMHDDGRMFYKPGPEAQAMFNQYHERFPGVKRFLKHAEKQAARNGFVRTIMGRRIRIHDKRFCYKAAAMCFQSWAAEVHKDSITRVNRTIKGTNSRLMISSHDELGISLDPEDKRRGLMEAIQNDYCANGAQSNDTNVRFRLRVPISASGGCGANWYEASK